MSVAQFEVLFCEWACDCILPFLQLGTKAAKDEEEHCHHFLRRMTTLEQTTSFLEIVCSLFHAKVGEAPCWTNVYNIPELAKNRLSLSMLLRSSRSSGSRFLAELFRQGSGFQLRDGMGWQHMASRIRRMVCRRQRGRGGDGS